MQTQAGATARLGAFIADAARAQLPPEVRRKAAYCLLDSLGLAILAREEACFTMYRKLLSSASGPGSARIWSDGKSVPLVEAVTANAIAVHAQFHDDTDYSSWTHPGSLIAPVAVALGESEGSGVNAVLRGVAAGYNAVEWLGARDVVARGLIDRGIRTSPTLGTLGAAAAAAALFRLDSAQATSAIGIASSMTGGILEPVRCGSDEWRVQNAHAARGGLLAAQLAREGMQGALQGLEGPKGLLRSLAGLQEIPEVWQQPPEHDSILGIVAKPWATLGDNMSAVLAAGLIHARAGQLDAQRVKRIRITIWKHFTEYPGTAYRGPFERVPQALASMAFATAAMLIYGELEYDKPLDHRQDQRILALLQKIEIIPDEHGNPFDATLEVDLNDGQTLTAEGRDADPRLLVHDRASSTALLEYRLLRSGYPAGAGAAVAALVLDAAESGDGAAAGGDVGIAEVLARLQRQ